MKLKHPRSKQAIEVDEAHAGIYESQGWKRVSAAKKAAEPAPAAKKAAARRGK